MANSSTNAKKVGSSVKILQLRHRSPPRTISSLHIGCQYQCWECTRLVSKGGYWGWIVYWDSVVDVEGLYKKDIDNVEYWEPEVGTVGKHKVNIAYKGYWRGGTYWHNANLVTFWTYSHHPDYGCMF